MVSFVFRGVSILPGIAIQIRIFDHKNINFAQTCAIIILQAGLFCCSWAVMTVLFQKAFIRIRRNSSLSGLYTRTVRTMFNRVHSFLQSTILSLIWSRGLNTMWYRGLGAKIGHSTLLSMAVFFDDPQVVSIGDRVLIGGGCALETVHDDVVLGVDVEDDVLISQKCLIGAGCKLESRASLLPITFMKQKSTAAQWASVSGFSPTRTILPAIVSYSPQWKPGYHLSGVVRQVAVLLYFVGILYFVVAAVLATSDKIPSGCPASIRLALSLMIGVLSLLASVVLTKRVFLNKSPSRTISLDRDVFSSLSWYLNATMYSFITYRFGNWMLGGPCAVLYLRLLGATVDWSAVIYSHYIFDWDLVTIGPHTVLKPNSTISPHVFVNVDFVSFETVFVGAKSGVGCNSLLLGGCSLSNGASIASQSRGVIGFPYNEPAIWKGVPAMTKVLMVGNLLKDDLQV